MYYIQNCTSLPSHNVSRFSRKKHKFIGVMKTTERPSTAEESKQMVTSEEVVQRCSINKRRLMHSSCNCIQEKSRSYSRRLADQFVRLFILVV